MTEDMRNATAAEMVAVEVALERRRQDAKWGEQNHADGTGREVPVLMEISGQSSLYLDAQSGARLANLATSATNDAAASGAVTWRDILLEEVFEALAEDDAVKLRTELIQVAAVAQQWAEAIDRRESLAVSA